MSYREIELVEELLDGLRPVSCLEWGAGYSTLFFPERLSNQAKWISVEHNKDWAGQIRDLKPCPRVDIHHVSANHFPWTDDQNDGAYSDLRDYIEYPEKFAPYDFILVDGRARNACVRRAYDFLSPDGIIVLHDANRPQYHVSTGRYPRQALFTGCRQNKGGLWLGSRNQAIEDLIDMAYHQAVWRLCRTAGKLIRC